MVEQLPAAQSADTALDELVRLPAGDPRRERLRAELVEAYLPLARSIAHRYAGRGEPLDDILQAALLGLVKALNRYDPEVGDRFLAYASPLMIGEVKRHFRDRTWAVRVSRRVQELRISLRETTQEFTTTHRRSPTVTELSSLLGISHEETVEVIGASEAYQPVSLDAPVAGPGETTVLGELQGRPDADLEGVEDREALWPCINALPSRERTIVLLRFFGNRTQSQIADELGISQMHVSRLLSATLARLRTQLLADAS